MSDKKSLSLLLLILLAGGVAVLWIGGLPSTGSETWQSDRLDAQPSQDRSRRRVVQDDWIEHLESGNPVRFESSKTDQSREVVPKTPPLKESAKAHLLSLFSPLEVANKLELASFRDAMDPTSEEDLLREASLMQQAEKAAAVVRAIHSDKYVLLDPDSDFPRQIEDGLVVFNNIVVHDKEKVDVVFYLRYAENPALAEAARHGKAVTEYWQKTSVDRFNGLPLSERKRRVEEHLAAEEALRTGPPEGLDPGWEVQQWKQRFYGKMLPGFFIVDNRSYLARLQSQ